MRAYFGIGLPNALDEERVGSEERAVDVVVPRADVVDAALGRADAVLQDTVADDQLAVVAVDAVDFRRIEKVGKYGVDDRNEDESEQNFPQQPVGAQPERSVYRLVRKRFGLAGECLDVGSPDKSFHDLKNCFDSCKFSVICIILQPER